MYVACEQAPCGGYREKSSLPRSLSSHFPRPNRRACSQATLQANLNGALNQALEMGQTSQKQFSDKHSVANSKTCFKVPFNFSGLVHFCVRQDYLQECVVHVIALSQ